MMGDGYIHSKDTIFDSHSTDLIWEWDSILFPWASMLILFLCVLCQPFQEIDV